MSTIVKETTNSFEKKPTRFSLILLFEWPPKSICLHIQKVLKEWGELF